LLRLFDHSVDLCLHSVKISLLQPARLQATAFKVLNAVVRFPASLCQCRITVALSIPYDVAERTMCLAFKEEAKQFAIDSPYPDASELFTDMYD